MAYILPRAFIVLVGWGITCGLIKNIWASVDPKVFLIAGISWAFAGLVCFGYLYKLRGDMQGRPSQYEGNSYSNM
jgi:hypothetical protein